jgi:hypothetical protein
MDNHYHGSDMAHLLSQQVDEFQRELEIKLHPRVSPVKDTPVTVRVRPHRRAVRPNGGGQ